MEYRDRKLVEFDTPEGRCAIDPQCVIGVLMERVNIAVSVIFLDHNLRLVVSHTLSETLDRINAGRFASRQTVIVN